MSFQMQTTEQSNQRAFLHWILISVSLEIHFIQDFVELSTYAHFITLKMGTFEIIEIILIT